MVRCQGYGPSGIQPHMVEFVNANHWCFSCTKEFNKNNNKKKDPIRKQKDNIVKSLGFGEFLDEHNRYTDKRTPTWLRHAIRIILDEANEQLGTAVVEPPKPVLTVADRERYRNILGPAVKQSVDVTSQERNKPSGPRQSQNIWLTEIEENIAVKSNGWKCFGCDCEYGTYTDVGNKHYVKVDPEQMHVTKTRKAGGTKEDVRVGCSTCNDIHGNGEGMTDAEFKAMVKKEYETRGYRNVKLTEVAA